ncbi:MAG: hypothetical protein WA354_20130 [Terracidiphilus sp.]
MALLEKAAEKKRSRVYVHRDHVRRYRARVLWITLIALGLMMVLAAILLASMDNYSWLKSNKDLPRQIHPFLAVKVVPSNTGNQSASLGTIRPSEACGQPSSAA